MGFWKVSILFSLYGPIPEYSVEFRNRKGGDTKWEADTGQDKSILKKQVHSELLVCLLNIMFDW